MVFRESVGRPQRIAILVSSTSMHLQLDLRSLCTEQPSTRASTNIPHTHCVVFVMCVVTTHDVSMISHVDLADRVHHTLLSACRCCSHAFSAGVRNDALAGDSARLIFVYKPIKIVGMPSTTNSHCQPANPSQPSKANSPAARGAPITCKRRTLTHEAVRHRLCWVHVRVLKIWAMQTSQA